MGSPAEVHGVLRSVYPERGKQILIDEDVNMEYVQHLLGVFVPGDVFILGVSIYEHTDYTIFENYVVSAYGYDRFFSESVMTGYDDESDSDGIWIARGVYDWDSGFKPEYFLDNHYPKELVAKHIAMIPEALRRDKGMRYDERLVWLSHTTPNGVIAGPAGRVSWKQWMPIKVTKPPRNVPVLVWMMNNYYVGYLDGDSHWNFFGVTPDGGQMFTMENDAPFVKAWAELPDPFRGGE